MSNCILIPCEKRKFEVPQSKPNPEKFGFGSSQFWYGKGRKGDKESNINANKYVDTVLCYIDNYKI